MEKICNTGGEVNASIIKDFLKSAGIHATAGPDSDLSANFGSLGPNQLYSVFVEHGKVEESLRLLKEQGFIKS